MYNKSLKIVELDTPLKFGEFKHGRLTATRHANGRDWWMIIPTYDGRGYEVYLFDTSGIRYQHTQSFGTEHLGITWGGSAFSPDGSKYGTIDMMVWDSTTLRF